MLLPQVVAPHQHGGVRRCVCISCLQCCHCCLPARWPPAVTRRSSACNSRGMLGQYARVYAAHDAARHKKCDMALLLMPSECS
jgi:hypothetical protein